MAAVTAAAGEFVRRPVHLSALIPFLKTATPRPSLSLSCSLSLTHTNTHTYSHLLIPTDHRHTQGQISHTHKKANWLATNLPTTSFSHLFTHSLTNLLTHSHSLAHSH